MPYRSNGPRARRLTVAALACGLAAAAVVPAASQADTTAVDWTIAGGSLTVAAPAITAFSATLTGVDQTVRTAVGNWQVDDATGSGDGYNVTASASAPQIGGAAAPAGSTITLTPPSAATDPDGGTADGPTIASGPLELTGGAVQVASAAAGRGIGQWSFAQGADDLAVVVPGKATAGAYTSTITFTTAPLAG